MKIFLVLIGLIAIVFAEQVEKDWGAFKTTFNKKYLTIPEVSIAITIITI